MYLSGYRHEFKREGAFGGVTTSVRRPRMSGDGEDPYVLCCGLAALPTPGGRGLWVQQPMASVGVIALDACKSLVRQLLQNSRSTGTVALPRTMCVCPGSSRRVPFGSAAATAACAFFMYSGLLPPTITRAGTVTPDR